VNTTTLAARLEHLERVGVVEKTVESTMPPRTRYELTASGLALQEVVDAIDHWARTHMPACREVASSPRAGGGVAAGAVGSGAGHPAHE
jgi:DNA-binding HxlR family transcriptional regulator